MSDQSARVQAIFFEAVEGHAPEAWPAFLESACAGDAELRAGVERLLRARTEMGSFHEPPRPALPPTVDDPVRERPGTVIGPYKLIQEVGEGGMGSVWMAQQAEPVKRLVALKVIKPGMDSRQVIARFGAERQALALMDHPNIARVFDAGTTSAGRPYFVMELVKGVPITKFCDERRLTPRERLELFVPVCQAIQHAHQKGVIHRDIKPSNVLVALYDGRPVPKVIDFGVAKATGQQLTDHTLVTGFGAVVGTLQYMSPEQAETNQLDIDTRSDIYSLGVLLYELLTGSTPLEKKRLKEAAVLEVLRLIREEEPQKPSTRLSSTEGTPSVAANRGLEPKKLSGLVRGELDWIVMKALAKERERRYETANGFAADVQRYLADEPVLACPPSAWYRLRKFTRRNKAVFTTGSLVAAALVLGTAISVWQAVRANNALDAERQTRDTLDRERVETEQQKSRINRDLSDALVETTGLREKARTLGPGRTSQWTEVREVARRVQTLAGHELADPLLVQRARALLAELARDDSDRRTVTKLEEIRLNPELQLKHGMDSPYLAAFREYGIPILDMKAEDAAKQIAASPIRDALVVALDNWAANSYHAYWGRLLPIAQKVSDDPWRRKYFAARLRSDKAAILELAKQPETLRQPPAFIAQLFSQIISYDLTTENILRQALALDPADLWLNNAMSIGPSSVGEGNTFLRVMLALRPESPSINFRLGGVLQRRGRDEEAIPFFERSLRFKGDEARVRPYLAISRGRSLEAQGKVAQAIEVYKAGLRHAQSVRDEYNLPVVVNFLLLDLLIDALERQGAPAEAIVRLLADYQKPHLEEGQQYLRRGDVLAKWGKTSAAIASYAEALIILNPDDEVGEKKLLGLLTKSGLLEETLAAWRKHAEATPGLSKVCLPLCIVLGRTGQHAEALAVWEKYAVRRSSDPYQIPGVLIRFGDVLARAEKLPQAAAAYRLAVNLRIGDVRGQRRLVTLLEKAGLSEAIKTHRMGISLKEQRKPVEAEHQYRKALAILEKLGPDFGDVPEYRQALATCYNDSGILQADLGKRAKAEEQYRKALAIRAKLAADFSQVPAYQVNLGGSYCNIGILVRDGGQPRDSLDWFEKAIRTLTAVHKQHRNLVLAKPYLRNSHSARATSYDRLKKYAEAVKDWDRAIELCPRQEQVSLIASRATSRVKAGRVVEGLAEIAELTKSTDWTAHQWYDFACVYAVASGLANEKKAEYAGRAMELLRKAVKAGYADVAHMKKDSDLDSIRKRDDFKKLIAEIEKKAAKPVKQP